MTVFLENTTFLGRKWRFWTMRKSDDLFFRDLHSAARIQNQLVNAARELKCLPTPGLDRTEELNVVFEKL